MTAASHSMLDGPKPVFRASRCVHEHLAGASCTACADACPQNALSLGESALEFDTEACDGCMLCVGACPQEAIDSGRGGIEAASLRKGENVYLGCAHSAPCVHALGWRDMLRLYAKGVRKMTVPAGACRRSDAGKARLETTLEHVNELLDSRNFPGVQVRYLAADQWEKEARQVSAALAVSPTRRVFLRRIADPAHARERNDSPATIAALLGEAAPPLAVFPAVPVIEPHRCDGCDACTRVCATGALTLAESDRLGYRVEASRCTGCSLCADVCQAGAVSVYRWASASQVWIDLVSRRCPACGVDYHAPKPRPDSLCAICATTGHHRKLFQTDPA